MGKEKKKKNVAVPLSVFIEAQGLETVGHYKTIESEEGGVKMTKTVAVKSANAAPQASFEVVIDEEVVKKGPPFRAYISNLPYDCSENDVRAHFLEANLTTVLLNTKENYKYVSSYVEVETIDELKFILERKDQLMGRRPVGVTLYDPIADRQQNMEKRPKKKGYFQDELQQGDMDFASARGSRGNQSIQKQDFDFSKRGDSVQTFDFSRKESSGQPRSFDFTRGDGKQHPQASQKDGESKNPQNYNFDRSNNQPAQQFNPMSFARRENSPSKANDFNPHPNQSSFESRGKKDWNYPPRQAGDRPWRNRDGAAAPETVSNLSWNRSEQPRSQPPRNYTIENRNQYRSSEGAPQKPEFNRSSRPPTHNQPPAGEGASLVASFNWNRS